MAQSRRNSDGSIGFELKKSKKVALAESEMVSFDGTMDLTEQGGMTSTRDR